MVGAMDGKVAGRSCQGGQGGARSRIEGAIGGQGAPGVGWRGPWVARWLPGAAKVARGRQESD